MSEIFLSNAEVIQARWPELLIRLMAENAEALQAELVEGLGSTLSIDGIQLTSRHGRAREAQVQVSSLPDDRSVVHVYGTGLGDIQQALLADSLVQQLHVHILNGAVFYLVLQLLEQAHWLSDPRVELAYAGDREEIQLPFFALPPEMVLADDFNAKIRDRLISETHLVFNNHAFDPETPDVVERLRLGRPLLEADADVAELFQTEQGREIYVIATGPSLEQHFDALREIRQRDQRPLFICVDTAYRPLMKHGITPDLVVSLDHRISFRHLPAGGSQGIGLVYFPMIDAEVLGAWEGKRYAAYSPSPMYARIRQEVSRAELYAAGSVIHPAIDLAVQMGSPSITLFGADFAFPMNKTHAGWTDGQLGPRFGEARHWVVDGHGQRVKTQLNFRSYLIELERYIARHPQVRFYNTSRAGALIAGTGFASEFVV